METDVLIKSRGSSTDIAEMTSRTDFVAPPPPAGPFKYMASTSLTTYSASFLVVVLAATLTRTS